MVIKWHHYIMKGTSFNIASKCIQELLEAFRTKMWNSVVSKKKKRIHNLCEDGINRGSYMSAHVLLNLLNKLGKRDKMRGLPSI